MSLDTPVSYTPSSGQTSVRGIEWFSLIPRRTCLRLYVVLPGTNVCLTLRGLTTTGAATCVRSTPARLTTGIPFTYFQTIDNVRRL